MSLAAVSLGASPHSSPGVQINLDAKEKHSGNRSLRLTFNGSAQRELFRCLPVHSRSTLLLLSIFRVGANADLCPPIKVFALVSTPSEIRMNSIAWTRDVRGTQPWTQLNSSWTSGKDVRELQLCVSRLPSAEFDSKIYGSAWIDDVALVPESAENTRQ